MKQAVIFDMDGVLIDSEQFYFKRRMKFFNNVGIEPSSRKIQDFIGLTNEMIWRKLVSNDKGRREYLKEQYTNYCKEHEVHYTEILNHSVREVFCKLKDKNIKIAIASSSEKKEILRMIKECELADCVDFVISGEECTKSKPDPEIYIKASKVLDVLPVEALAIEDSTLGIHAAKLAGLTVGALVQKDYYIDQAEADYQINDLEEIITKI